MRRWVDKHEATIKWRAFAKVVVLRMLKRKLASAWAGWCAAHEQRMSDHQMAEGQSALARMESMAAENDRLRRDNERFVRLIDSGEWGRSRVEEMTTAGAVLRVRACSSLGPPAVRVAVRDKRERTHTGGGNAPGFKPPPMPPADASPVEFDTVLC